MSNIEEPVQPQPRAVPVRWLVAIALIAGAAALIWVNGHSVLVRPFGRAPLNQIMAAPLILGFVIGWFVRSRIATRAARAAARRAAAKSASSD